MNKLFEQMFGSAKRPTPATDDDLRLTQKYHPNTFQGYPQDMLVEFANNPNLVGSKNGQPHVGYENMFGGAAQVFSPEDPQAFGKYLQSNLRNMDPYAIKRLMDYVQWINQANELKSRGGPR